MTINPFHWNYPPFHWDNPTGKAIVVGPIGSGTDDSGNIQNAIDALSSTGGTVILTADTYTVSSSITPKSGVHIVGVKPSMIGTGACPDLGWIANSGTILKASTTGITCFSANKTTTAIASIDEATDTITTSTAHGYVVGDIVQINEVTAAVPAHATVINRAHTVTAVGSATTFTINTDLAGITLNDATGNTHESLSNVRFKDFMFKGFDKCIDVGTTNGLGLGMGGLEGIVVDGTGDDDSTVQTSLAFRFVNSQQMYSHDIMISSVTEGIKIINDGDTCSSGNSLWEKVYVDMDTSTTAPASSALTAVTTGSDQVTVADGSSFSVGDVVGISGATGASVADLNRTHVIKSVTGNDIVLEDDLANVTYTSGGTLYKGRVGIHLQSLGTQPLNHVTFIAPQVNFFLGAEQLKGFVNIALTADSTGSVNNCDLISCDVEGPSDNHIFMSGASQCSVSVNATVNVPTNGNFMVELGTHNFIFSADPDVTVFVGKSTSPLTGSGTFASFTATSNSFLDGVLGGYYDSTDTVYKIGFKAGADKQIEGNSVNAEFVKPGIKTAFGDCLALTVSGSSQALNGNHYGVIKHTHTGAPSTITLPPTASAVYTGGIITIFVYGAAPNLTVGAATGNIRGSNPAMTTQYEVRKFMCIDGANDEWIVLH